MHTSIVPLYPVEPYALQMIQVADQPLPLARTVYQKSLDDFCKEVAKQRKIPHFKFSENIHLPEGLRQQIEKLCHIPKEGLKLDPRVISQLIICDSGALNIGKMLYTVSALERGRLLLTYSGQVCVRGSDERNHQDDYEFQIQQSGVLQIPPGHSMFITAEKMGGFASFIQDLVDPMDGFTLEGDVAQVNLLALPFGLLGMGSICFIALEKIGAKEPLSISYGTDYWKSFADKKVCKIFLNRQGKQIKGMLLEEKFKKIKLLKAILHRSQTLRDKNADLKAKVSHESSEVNVSGIDYLKKQLAILLAVVPGEIVSALSDEEQRELHAIAPSFTDIPAAEDYSVFFPEYEGYDSHYLTASLIQAGKDSPLSALAYLKIFSPISRQSADKEGLIKQSEEISKKAMQFFKDEKYDEAIKNWVQVARMHSKLYASEGMIYYKKFSIPLHSECIKIQWNVGNAFLKAQRFLDALESLRLAHHLQQYFDKMAISNKSLKDMQERSAEVLNQLTNQYMSVTGIPPQRKI